MDLIATGALRTMSSREIAELTEKEHFNVLADIRKMLADLGLADLSFQGSYKDSTGRTLPTFDLPEDLTITLVSGYSVQMRHRIVKRWQELEAQTQAAPAIPQTFAAALRLAAEQQEQIEQQAAALALAAPKVEFVDRYVDASGTQTFRQVSKLLQAKEPAFRAFLAARRVMYQIGGAWAPYAEHIDAGRFVVKTGSADNGHAFSSARFTPKGVAWVSALWLDAIGGAA